jgi:endogenous inhibitor of DNA gyrase (YacG/DUF329 family)
MSEPVRLRVRRPCPICGKLSHQKFHPFCSSRCAQVDLNRWLGGHYAIPSSEPDAEETPDETSDG